MTGSMFLSNVKLFQTMKIKDKPAGWKGGSFIPSRYFSAIKYNANRRKIPFSIDINYLDAIWVFQQGNCAYSGRNLVLPTKNDPGTASLDRIDSSLGYQEGNVQFVHRTINFMKHKMGEQEFLEFVKEICEYKGL